MVSAIKKKRSSWSFSLVLDNINIYIIKKNWELDNNNILIMLQSPLSTSLIDNFHHFDNHHWFDNFFFFQNLHHHHHHQCSHHCQLQERESGQIYQNMRTSLLSNCQQIEDNRCYFEYGKQTFLHNVCQVIHIFH